MRPVKASFLLLPLLASALCFAAAPDRITAPIVAAQTVRLAAGVPMKARPEFDQGPVDPSLKLGYITLLTAPSASQQKTLNRLLAQQQDPHSPYYHRWLTPEQYAERFGLSPNDIKKITTWLQSQGFTVLSTARGRNWITFSGTAVQVESAFQTEIHRFSVDGEMHFANTTPASIPAALSGIVAGFRGLNNFWPKSHALHSNPDYTLKQGNNSFLFLAPGDIATIYDLKPLFNAGIDGTGQKLAVIGQTDVYLADLADFRSGFGLSTINCTTSATNVITACNTANFQYVLVNADPGTPHSGDLAEADIDLEWSGAVASNAQIIYVNAPDLSGGGVFDSMYHTIDNNLAPVMTMSYGFCELDEALSGFFASDEAEFQKANAEGITFLNSSGDSGAAECDFQTHLATGGYAVTYPASSPEVTGVGGTLIPYNEYSSTYWSASNGTDGGSALQYIPELAWNDSQEWGEYCAANAANCNGLPFTDWQSAQSVIGLLAAGGGASNCHTINGSGACTSGFPQPTYQQGLTIPGQTTAVRFSPDVALLASVYWPGYIVCTAQSEIGGSGSASSCASGIASALAGCTGQLGLCSVFGGTSVASPVFAGIVTLLNQYLTASAPGLGNINPTLYTLAHTPANGAFHQLTTGSSGAFCAPGTPSNQPTALQCPGSGFLGFDASNFDATTGYNLVNGLGSIDANNLALAWAAGRSASTTTVVAAPTNTVLGHNVKLTATVTPSTATGTVSFFNNGSGTALGTGTVSSGVATFSTTSLPLGTNNITATYGGDGYNAPSTTATPAVVTITSPDFTWTSSDLTHTVLAGQTSLAYNFTATPVGSSTFAAAVTYACSFAPTDTTVGCTFNPTSIAVGAVATPVTLTITTKGPNTGTGTAVQHRADKRSPWLPLTLPIAGIIMVGIAGRKVSKYSLVASLCVSLALLGLLVACGGGSSTPISVTVSPGTPSSLFPNNAGWPSQTAQFTATVNNNSAVTWAVTGGAANGTIDANGKYTAPTVAAGLPATVTITATSVADPSKSGSAQETLKTPTALGTFNVTVTATEAQTDKPFSVTLTVQ